MIQAEGVRFACSHCPSDQYRIRVPQPVPKRGMRTIALWLVSIRLNRTIVAACSTAVVRLVGLRLQVGITVKDKLIRSILQDLLGVVVPAECLWCHQPVEPGTDFCARCEQFFIDRYYRCRRCASPMASVLPNDSCVRCREANWKFSEVITLGRYQGHLREAAILIKKRGYEGLRSALGRRLGELLLANRACQVAAFGPDALIEPAVLVPVPNHWTRTFAGTANTTLSLAQAIGKRSGLPVHSRLIRRTRITAKQGMLSWGERKQNVDGAFSLVTPEQVSAMHIYLVDDVLTSGATCNEIAASCLKNGCRRVSVLVVARGTGNRQTVPAESMQAIRNLAPEPQ
jgi:ComF family protein